MPDCRTIDPLVTPYVDGELSDTDRRLVDAHVAACPPCYSRVAAERAVRETLCARRRDLASAAPPALRAACERMRADAARLKPRGPESEAPGTLTPGTLAPGALPRGTFGTQAARGTWKIPFVPFALAASIVVLVGGAFVYQVTDSSATVLAAELTADHVKCFTMNTVLGTHQTQTTVEAAMLSGFGWHVRLPQNPSQVGLELVGSRPCLYGEGTIAHVMYRHDGRPVSLFMLPKSARAEQFVEVLGHEAKIWCAGNRTLVLVAREPRKDVERLAEYVQASLH